MRASPAPSTPPPRPLRRRWPPSSWPSVPASPPTARLGRRTGAHRPGPGAHPRRPVRRLLDQRPCLCLGGQAALQRGDLDAAREHLGRAAGLRPLLTHALPVVSVQTLLDLARAYIALGDPDGAHAVLRQADDIFQQRPNLGVLPAQANELRERLATMRRTGLGASSLTTAELRLLPLLTTHLSFSQISMEFSLSPHTVKTQALSIYRKLGVSLPQ